MLYHDDINIIIIKIIIIIIVIIIIIIEFWEKKIITRKYMIVICLCEMKTSRIKVLNWRKIYYCNTAST